jgi:uncharacterized protein with FMN-binding domain
MLRKLFLSAFVIFTFAAYVIHQRFTNPDSALVPTASITSIPTLQGISPAGGIAVAATPLPTFAAVQPSVVPDTETPVPVLPTDTAQPTAANAQLGAYKDGSYTGPVVDAYYGLVEVQVNVQNGKIANVQFLQYPNDRNTSVRINSFAMPYLQQEALQAQSANVNIISGATLTSEGFMMSLDAALKTAKN